MGKEPLVSNLFFQGKWVFERQWRGHIRAQFLRRGSGGYQGGSVL